MTLPDFRLLGFFNFFCYRDITMNTTLAIYTDGGCSGNPGPGGWAYVIVENNVIVSEQWGAEHLSTNNRMELSAVIESLKAIKTMPAIPDHITIYTDSQYTRKGITEWIRNWKRNNWRTSDKKPVKNQDLWMELDSLAAEFSLTWEWVPGHAGVEYNERCDHMTQTAIASISVKR